VNLYVGVDDKVTRAIIARDDIICVGVFYYCHDTVFINLR
jgi:hypothetical protein